MKNMQQTENENQEVIKAPELLAPAGSFQTAKAVIHAGADAVYLGGGRFGARAYADNLSQEELLEVIDYAHLHHVKVYLTVNTLLKQHELEELYDYLLPYYMQGLDAVIVQDYGVMQYIRRCFPNLPLHVSTQMSVVGVYGAAYLKSKGAARIVTARELSLKEISEIHKQVDIEIESFVHGALCYCYSGQCLFSSMLGGRSGNRGRCAQPCRLPYTVLDADRRPISRPDSYPLSLKDLCALELIPQLASAGISSFKIEGRVKSPEYAAGVTAVYRKYIDRYKDGGRFLVQKQDVIRLKDTGSRGGFTQGYYFQHNDRQMVTLQQPSYVKNHTPYIDQVRARYIDTERKIPVRAIAELKCGEPAKLWVFKEECMKGLTQGPVENLTKALLERVIERPIKIDCGFAQDDIVQAAQNQPISREMAIQQLSKTGNTPYDMKSVEVVMDGQPFLPKQALNRLRRNALENLTQAVTERYRRGDGVAIRPRHILASQAAQPAQKGAPEVVQAARKGAPEVVQAAQKGAPEAIQAARKGAPEVVQTAFYAAVETEAQLNAVLEYSWIGRVYLDSAMYADSLGDLARHAALSKAAGKQAYLILPAVFRGRAARFYQARWAEVEQAGVDGYLVKSQDELGFLCSQGVDQRRCVLDHSLYTWSDEAKAAYRADGWVFDTVALELNKKELSGRSHAQSELLIYGYLPLMTSAQCIWKTLGRCIGAPSLCYLKDRYAKEFPVKNNCMECYNIIYNSSPLSLIRMPEELAALHPAAFRLHFTIEPAKQVHKILGCVRQSFLEHRVPDMPAAAGAYTKGHFKRGVE